MFVTARRFDGTSNGRRAKNLGKRVAESRRIGNEANQVIYTGVKRRTMNSVVIGGRDTLRRHEKKLPPVLRDVGYLIESPVCGRASNQPRLSTNEIVMKFVSIAGTCGNLAGTLQILFRIFTSWNSLVTKFCSFDSSSVFNPFSNFINIIYFLCDPCSEKDNKKFNLKIDIFTDWRKKFKREG